MSEPASAFARQVRGQKRPAPLKFRLLPEHFADTWGGNRPVAGIELGLRLPSKQDLDNATIEANRAADAAPDSSAELVRKSTLLCLVVARAICSPHDVALPHPFFELPEDQLPVALRDDTIARLWDEVERLYLLQSQAFREATRDELLELADRLQVDDPWEGIDPSKAAQARRYLLFALDILNREE